MELHVVMFSTGLTSAVVLEMVQKRYGNDNTLALMTDTKWEDEDNYRFGREVIKHLNAKLEYRADGRTPEDIWLQTRYLVGPTGAPCTRKLKVEQTLKFIREQDKEIRLHFGITADEEHRCHGLERRYGAMGVRCEFPLLDCLASNRDLVDRVQKGWGIRRPRMYDLGFKHANCGGRCVKAGVSHFKHLLKIWPDKFTQIAGIERRFRELTESDTSILVRTVNGESVKYPLERLEADYMCNEGLQCEFAFDEETPCECVF